MASDKSVMALIKALKPTFRIGNNNDKVAFAVHSFFLASGYNLTATGPRAFSRSALTSSPTDEVGIEEWNEVEDQYAFVYANPEAGLMKVLVKCLVMEGKLHVYYALADGSSKHVELNVGDYVEENGGGNYSKQFKNVKMLVKNLESLMHPSCSETSETNCARRIKIQPEPGVGTETQLSGHKRKQLDNISEENKIPATITNVPMAGSVKVGRLEEEKVSMLHVYSTRRVKRKTGSGSNEAVGLGILIEDKTIDDKVYAEPHDVRVTAPKLPTPKAQPTTASKVDNVPVTQFHQFSDEILPTPVKKMSPHHLQDGEVYQGRRR